MNLVGMGVGETGIGSCRCQVASQRRMRVVHVERRPEVLLDRGVQDVVLVSQRVEASVPTTPRPRGGLISAVPGVDGSRFGRGQGASASIGGHHDRPSAIVDIREAC